MKKIFYLSTFLFLATTIVHAQKPWKAKLFVHFIDSANQIKTDTVWVGCDTVGDEGFQADLDVFDTVGADSKILSHDSIVQQQLNTDCGNLKCNIKKMQYGITSFHFYAMGKIVSISWDTSDFIYDDTISNFFIEDAYFISYSGYIGGWDNTTLYLISRFANRNYVSGDSVLVIAESPLYYCSRKFNLFSFSLNIKTSEKLIYEGLNELTAPNVLLSPNPCKDILYLTLHNKDGGHTHISIKVYSLTGQLLKMLEIPDATETNRVDLTELKEGVYILEINDKLNNSIAHYKILKSNF